MNTTTKNIILLLLTFLVLASCKKDFLNENPRTDQIIPTTLQTCQAILDDDFVMNSSPNLGELSSDNFYITDRKSTRLNSSHLVISYAVFCLKKKNITITIK